MESHLDTLSLILWTVHDIAMLLAGKSQTFDQVVVGEAWTGTCSHRTHAPTSDRLVPDWERYESSNEYCTVQGRGAAFGRGRSVGPIARAAFIVCVCLFLIQYGTVATVIPTRRVSVYVSRCVCGLFVCDQISSSQPGHRQTQASTQTDTRSNRSETDSRN